MSRRTFDDIREECHEIGRLRFAETTASAITGYQHILRALEYQEKLLEEQLDLFEPRIVMKEQRALLRCKELRKALEISVNELKATFQPKSVRDLANRESLG